MSATSDNVLRLQHMLDSQICLTLFPGISFKLPGYILVKSLAHHIKKVGHANGGHSCVFMVGYGNSTTQYQMSGWVSWSKRHTSMSSIGRNTFMLAYDSLFMFSDLYNLVGVLFQSFQVLCSVSK